MPPSLSIPRRGLRRATPSEAELAYHRLSAVPAGSDADGFGRRAFLQGSLAAGAGLAVLPSWMDEFAAAATPIASHERIIVSLFLSGGNDSLHTLIPAESSAYRSAREGMRFEVGSGTDQLSSANAVGEGLYLNPRMPGLKSRFDAGQVAFVQGVGEETNDHSHFTSTATWMAGIQNMAAPSGWLGRFAQQGALGEFGVVSVGAGAPLLLRAPGRSPVAMPANGGLFGGFTPDNNSDRALAEGMQGYEFAGLGIYSGVIGKAWASAVDSANLLNQAYTDGLPGNGLPRDMAVLAELINLDVGVRIGHTVHHGFDTHAGQRPGHDNLLENLDDALEEFFTRLDPAFANRTAVLIWSEFGRRVEANNSVGTDHGAAGLATLVGPNVKGGLHGSAPSLSNLDSRGDMRFQVDFRSVYSSVIEQWLDGDDFDVLQKNYETLDLFDTSAFPNTGTPTTFPSGNQAFDDVPSGAYYTIAVGWLAHKGITTGTGYRRFSPDDVVNRAQMATFLWRYRLEPTALSPAGFSDVPSGVYFSDAVDWLLESGVTTGVGGNRYAPDDPVSRAQMATFLWRLEGSPPGAPAAGFVDVPAGRYYSEAVDWLLHRGITTGTGPGRYSPDALVSRAQMATFLWRLAGQPI